MLQDRVDAGTPGVLEAYEGLVRAGSLQADPAQAELAGKLQGLADRLEADARKGAGIGSFFGARKQTPQGFYVWGDVGRGKTLLMDLFFAGVKISQKRRVHFHEFMNELHGEIARIRLQRKGRKNGADPIAEAVRPIVKSTRLLCFDEFHVTDITNAMLLGRLFERLCDGGLVVVATSNVPPERLYENGLNRQLFEPFVDLLKTRCQVLHLGGDSDYRLAKLSRQPVFCFGAPGEVREDMDRLWDSLTGGQGQGGDGEPVRVLGREIVVPAQGMGCARFGFADLCERPLGSRDYLAITQLFHTLVLDDVPRFSRDNSNAAKRFILLVDTLYDRGVKLVASFAVPLAELSGDPDTAFEFRRTVSRLNEMSSIDYLGRAIDPDRLGG